MDERLTAGDQIQGYGRHNNANKKNKFKNSAFKWRHKCKWAGLTYFARHESARMSSEHNVELFDYCTALSQVSKHYAAGGRHYAHRYRRGGTHTNILVCSFIYSYFGEESGQLWRQVGTVSVLLCACRFAACVIPSVCSKTKSKCHLCC